MLSGESGLGELQWVFFQLCYSEGDEETRRVTDAFVVSDVVTASQVHML